MAIKENILSEPQGAISLTTELETIALQEVTGSFVGIHCSSPLSCLFAWLASLIHSSDACLWAAAHLKVPDWKRNSLTAVWLQTGCVPGTNSPLKGKNRVVRITGVEKNGIISAGGVEEMDDGVRQTVVGLFLAQRQPVTTPPSLPNIHCFLPCPSSH